MVFKALLLALVAAATLAPVSAQVILVGAGQPTTGVAAAPALWQREACIPKRLGFYSGRLKLTHYRQDVTFDDHNQGGRSVVLEKIADRRVVVEQQVQLGR